MKKIILVLLTAFTFSFVASAQNMGTVTSGGVTAAYLYANPLQSTSQGSFQFNVTRVSSGANGSILLQCSNDGTNWITPNAADTLHISNSATQYLMYNVLNSTGLTYKQYRFKCLQIAGDTCTISGYFFGRQ